MRAQNHDRHPAARRGVALDDTGGPLVGIGLYEIRVGHDNVRRATWLQNKTRLPRPTRIQKGFTRNETERPGATGTLENTILAVVANAARPLPAASEPRIS